MISTVLLVVQIILSLLLVGIVLLQRSESDGLGLGGASGGAGLFSARGQANFLTRTTSILAALFFANCLLLNIVMAKNSSSALIDEIEEDVKTISVPKDGASSPTPAPAPAPATDAAPPEEGASAPESNAPADTTPAIEQAPVSEAPAEAPASSTPSTPKP